MSSTSQPWNNMPKLVRNKIPEILDAKGIDYVICEGAELNGLRWLGLKIIEEAREVQTALLGSDDNVEEELADVLELIYAIADVEGISFGDIQKTRMHKKRQKGGFSSEIVLESIDGKDIGEGPF